MPKRLRRDEVERSAWQGAPTGIPNTEVHRDGALQAGEEREVALGRVQLGAAGKLHVRLQVSRKASRAVDQHRDLGLEVSADIGRPRSEERRVGKECRS